MSKFITHKRDKTSQLNNSPTNNTPSTNETKKKGCIIAVVIVFLIIWIAVISLFFIGKQAINKVDEIRINLSMKESTKISRKLDSNARQTKT